MYTRRQMRLRDKQCMSKSVSMQMRSKILIGYLYLTPRMFAQIVPHSKILWNFKSKCLHVCTFCAIFAPPERHICNFILFNLLIHLFLILCFAVNITVVWSYCHTYATCVCVLRKLQFETWRYAKTSAEVHCVRNKCKGD